MLQHTLKHAPANRSIRHVLLRTLKASASQPLYSTSAAAYFEASSSQPLYWTSAVPYFEASANRQSNRDVLQSTITLNCIRQVLQRTSNCCTRNLIRKVHHKNHHALQMLQHVSTSMVDLGSRCVRSHGSKLSRRNCHTACLANRRGKHSKAHAWCFTFVREHASFCEAKAKTIKKK